MATLKNFLRHRGGATTIEYAILAGILAIAIVGGATALGSVLNVSLSNQADKVDTAFD